VLFFIITTKKKNKWPEPSPPHPPTHTIFGNIPTLRKLDPIIQFAFHELYNQYGKLFRLKMGPRWMLIVAGYEELKDILNKDYSTDRPLLKSSNDIYFGTTQPKGILFNFGPDYKELRRYTLRTLRDFGFGKKGSESIVLDECESMKIAIIEMMKKNDGIINVDKLFNKAALNVVWSVTADERYDYDDKNMEKLYHFLDLFTLMGRHIIGKPLGIFPILKHFPPFRQIYNKASNGMAECRAFIKETIERHEKTLDPNNPRDFIDKFLVDMEKESSTAFTKEHLLFCCLDLFLGGSETTSKSLMFALVMLIRNPEIQEKVFEEINEATNDNEVVTMADREKLPFTEATLNEVWRSCNVIPILPPRITTGPLKLNNYDIPENTGILASTMPVHLDADYWNDPEVFRPERFIKNGKFVADDRNIPFGIGKRRCLGETLARIENFLFFANLVKNFKFSSANEDMPDLRPEPGFTNGPKPFDMKVNRRS